MALLSISLSLPSSSTCLTTSATASTSSSNCGGGHVSVGPQHAVALVPFSAGLVRMNHPLTLSSRLWRRVSHVVRMAPEEERITRRSPLDFPIEWDRPKPARRPDIFPQFSPMKTPLPPPLPADPPEEDEEEEEEKKEEEEEDPEKENPDNPEKNRAVRCCHS